MPTELNNPLADIFKVPELKRRILFTLGIIAAYRVGATIPVPGVNADALRGFFAQQQNTLLGFLNIFSGGAMGRLAIFAMGVGPYINASIIISLLQGAHVIPYLDRLAKEGQQGQKQMNQITRYLTLALGGLQSFGLALKISKMPGPGGMPIVIDPSAGWIALTVMTLTTGSVFIMWLGEQITEQGIGNGVSLIIFSGIVDRMPSAIADLVRLVRIEEIFIFQSAVAGGSRDCRHGTRRVGGNSAAQNSRAVRQTHCRAQNDGWRKYVLAAQSRPVRRHCRDFCRLSFSRADDGSGLFSAFALRDEDRAARIAWKLGI